MGVFAVLVGLAGSARAQVDLDEILLGYCRAEYWSGGTVYFGAIFEGDRRQQSERDKEFLSIIRSRYPDATTSPDNWDICAQFTYPSVDGIISRFEDRMLTIESLNWRVVFMDWVPPNTRLVRTLRHQDNASEGDEKMFGPKAEKALNAWRDKHGIEGRGAIANTLMLMVQTALILQAFDPGPADGVIGKRTLAAIIAWQTMQGFPEGAELAGLIAAILRAALVLEGYDPGPVEEMFGPSAIEAAQAWAPSYEQVKPSQASGAIGQPTDADSREQKQVERHVARALANECIRLIHPPGVTAGTFFKAKLKNICNYAVDVTFGYNVKLDGTPIQAPWCTVGHAGSSGGSMTLSPGQHKSVAPIDYGKRYRVFWCACDKRLAWAAFAEPKERSADRCTCRCAPN